MACNYCTGHDNASGGTCSHCGAWYCGNCADKSYGSVACPNCGHKGLQARQTTWGEYNKK
ncbi:hypothetical protein [Ectobacillus polymachus]|uniref:hypothetical protein n=1 Tax=Ectobacillus polymachus TaxID=1508806 RepID=UPI003A894319